MQRASEGGRPDDQLEPAHCHFDLAAPRHFVFPAILMLLSEKPRHGYRLIEPITELGFGAVDRPTVYRALADLERDGLLESWNAEPTAGATRHVYALTAAGRGVLDRWMGVLADERERLEGVLQRYALLDHPRAPFSATVPPSWPREPDRAKIADREGGVAPDLATRCGRKKGSMAAVTEQPTAFEIIAESSAIMIRARSNVGTIEFGTTGLRGTIEVSVRDSSVRTETGVKARVEVDVASLTSGNALYDAELMNRVHARMFPMAVVELDGVQPLGAEDRFQVEGRLTFHGVTATMSGAVGVTALGDRKLVVSGEKVIDIRDFEIAAPAMLMLKIYPDVRVFLHLEAEANGPAPAGSD